MPSLLILNGPNLNMLGTREPEIYGATTLADIEAMCRETAAARGASVECVQSNHEGALLDALHGSVGRHDGVVFNAGAYTHSSYALHDGIKSIALPVIELHISNVHARESFRHVSMISAAALGVIAGFGVNGYRMAINGLLDHLETGS